MSLSVCCQWLQPKTKRSGEVVNENIINEQSLQLGAYKDGKYTRERIIDTYRNNVNEHLRILPTIIETGIKSFRLSSSLFPLFEFCGELARNDQQLLEGLATLGNNFKKAGIRVSTHPGQFTVLSSDKQQVVDNSIKELEYHAWIFDQMGFDRSPYYAINIHGGKKGKSEQLKEVIESLPETVRNRLTLENDEKCYNVKSLLEISNKTGTPIVLDTHHFTFNDDDLSLDAAISETISTWGNIKPLQHLSNTEKGLENASYTQRRSHSQYIHYVPEQQLHLMRENLVDVDIEAKAKNLAVIQLRREFNVEV